MTNVMMMMMMIDHNDDGKTHLDVKAAAEVTVGRHIHLGYVDLIL